MREAPPGFFCWTAMGAALGLTSCLPGDTRPVPGSLPVTVTGEPPLLGGDQTALTVDGWAVSYQKFLLSVGGASLDDEAACASYYDADYRRIVNLRIPGPQKLSIVYGLGHCDFGFRVAGPDSDSILGASVTEADKTLMGTPDMDPYTTDRSGKPAATGISLYVKGRATKDAVTKTFTWAFRQRLRYEKCGEALPGAPGGLGSLPDAATRPDASSLSYGGIQGVDLRSAVAGTLDLAVHGETLFLDSTYVTHGALRFDVLAAADDQQGNADGDIALSELGLVLLTDIPDRTSGTTLGSGSRYAQSGDDLYRGGIGGPIWNTLEDFVYLGLFPHVVRFDGDGDCVVNTGPRR